MTTTQPSKYSFWLLPVETERDIYQDLIHRLSHTYDAPDFAPHVTIYSGIFAPETSPEQLVAQAIAGISPFTMQVNGLRYTDTFLKSLFIQLQPSPPLQAMSETIGTQALPVSNYVLDPHLSLLYKRLPESEKQRIVASIQLPNTTISFDEVSVISTPTPTRTAHDVARWQEVHRQKLPG